MINFDNAATTYPKPAEVKRAVINGLTAYGGNAGRGGHKLTQRTSKAVFDTREKVAEFFDAQVENVVFTLNCTHALNYAIHGIMGSGGHLVISDFEHNSALRPATDLAQDGKITLSIAKVYEKDEDTIKSFLDMIKPNTKAVVCLAASNVTGQLLPIKELAKICSERNICFIVDAAQVSGVVDIKISDGINILCTAGHKGLYGITGTGILISDGKYKIKPIIQGGTGSASTTLKQPEFLPDALESGTSNIIGIISVGSGIDFIKRVGMKKIFEHETKLCNLFIRLIKNTKGISIYRNPESRYVPIVSFNIEGFTPEELAKILSDNNFCLRAGFHCAALIHHNIGTEKGTVRFAPSAFNNENEVYKLANIINNIESYKNL